VLRDKKATPVYISRPDPMSQQEEYYRSNFWNYYRATQDLVGDPGYYLMHTEYYWESNLYEWPAQSLAFTSHSESVDPPGFETLAHGYGRSLVKELKRKGLVTDRKEQKKAF
jgi:hypothetical protein